MDEKIIGHSLEIASLKNQIDQDRLSHSYIFQGEEGIGKKKLAMAFSKTLLCREGGSSACNRCDSCLKFDRENHPDFKLIQGENNIIRKNQVDEIVASVKTKPFESPYKIFIIDDSHNMNKESMNGLLKTLEEAADFLIIILITSRPEELLDTVRSRCQTISLYPLSRKEMRSYLEEEGIDSKMAASIASLSKGSISLARELIESEDLVERREKLLSIIDSLLSGNKAIAFSSIEFFEDNRDRLDEILDMMVYWFRDLAVYKETSNIDLLVNVDKEELLSKQSHIHFEAINDIIENIENTRYNIDRNVNFVLSIEMMLLNIQEDN